jgi:hypothetical protein
MVELPIMPQRIAKLPRDHRGYPVPWFVQWFKDSVPVMPGEGEPDFRVIDTAKFNRCLAVPRCWVCGEGMGRHKVSIIGPMCAVNRVISEPQSHRSCAEFSVQACPFLSRPRMRRNPKDLPEVALAAAGMSIERNPGVVCIWESDVQPFHVHAGVGVQEGVLFKLGEPRQVDWWTLGRIATRAEVIEAIDNGYPQLEEAARRDGAEAIKALKGLRVRVQRHLPPREQAA